MSLSVFKSEITNFLPNIQPERTVCGGASGLNAPQVPFFP